MTRHERLPSWTSRARWANVLAALTVTFSLLPGATAPVVAQAGDDPLQTEGSFLYKVTTMRAAPGRFNDLAGAIERSFRVMKLAGDRPPFWIRHSQGDQWDFMLIYPMGDFAKYFSAERNRQRTEAWSSDAGRRLESRFEPLVSYREDWFARSVDADELARRFEGAGLFHVEMFVGLPGHRKELYEQRRMENRYYEELGRRQNVIFIRVAGSNWDAMTIGFHEDLQAFAAGGSLHSEAEQEAAARAAGFDGVDAIGPYLRSLLDRHHDTLGVRAR